MSIATFSQREQPKAANVLETGASLVSAREIAGHVYDPAGPETRFVVELLLDGHPVQIARAHQFDASLAERGLGDGCYRFTFALSEETAAAASLAEVRIANTGETVGAPLDLANAEIEPPRRDGEARWDGGLRIQGWIAWDPKALGKVRAFIDGVQVAETRASYFSHVGDAVSGGVARGFHLTLPLDFADGRLRRVKVVDENGRELPGSPCPLIAFPRGLEQFLESQTDLGGERVRAGLFDRLLPQSVPASEFLAWARAFPPAPALSAPRGRIAVAVIGDTGLDQTLESLGAAGQAEEAIVGALRFADGPMTFATDDLHAFLQNDGSEAEFVIFAPAGTRFHSHALARFAEALTRFPEAQLAYCDLVLADDEGRQWPLAFSAFDYERLLEQGYAAFCFAARTDYLRKAVNSGVGDLFRLFNFAFDAGGPGRNHPAVHVPGFLASLPTADRTRATATLVRATRQHLETRQLNVNVEPRPSELLPAARVRRSAPEGKVSVVVPTRNRADLLKPCLDSLEKTLGSQPHEIFVVDNDSSDPETLDYFDEITRRGVRIARVSGPFNYARLVNAGASVASGEYMLLLNNDIEALNEGWLPEMLSRLAEPDVGAVGARLLYPSGGIQHGGVVLGPKLAATHAFDERYDGDPGYGELLNVAHETSAVTAACLLTPRRLFRVLGGFDGTRFPVLFNDVDYCLRLRAAGRRVVFTPFVRMMHKAGSSRGREAAFNGRHRHQRDIDNLRMAWAEVLADDPFYSPMLGLDAPYSGLAWPPRSQAPRSPRIEKGKIAPAGF